MPDNIVRVRLDGLLRLVKDYILKWYKHVSTSLDDPFICELMYQFRSDAYLVFFGTLEIYSREFSPEIGWKFEGNLRYFRQKFQISNAKIKKILSAINKWEVKFNGDNVSIFIPKFKELIDNYTRNEKMNTDNKLASHLQETCTPIKNKEERLKNKEKDNRGIFQIPSVQEISDYCQQRKNKIDPQYFIDYQTARDWKLKGGQKIKDWKAVIRTWEKNNFESTPQAKSLQKQESPYEKCPRCGKELRKGYEYINIGGQKCCEYCPEARVKAKQDYERLSGLLSVKSM